MSESHIILCPGQGAQRVGMGKAWFEASPIAAQTFGAADAVLGDTLGAPLSELCFNGPADTLDRTDVAQPALYTCAVACYQAWIGDEEILLAATAGLSLGEYSALHLAGALSFEDGLRIVTLRGRAMQDAAESADSSMVALIGADEAQAVAVCDAVTSESNELVLVPANFNAPGQIVLSGHSKACARAVEIAQEKSLRATALSVAGAFHSPIMQPAAERLASALEEVEINAPRCPVLSNVTGEPHPMEGDDFSQGIKQSLVAQLTSPVRWDACCQWLASHVEGAYHEMAPGKVLSGLMRRIERSIKVTNHDEPS